MPAESPPPKWRRRSKERPAEIVSAAYAVFAEKGFAAAKLEDIAARAGVSKGALYLYFGNKQDIFEAVVHDAIAPNISAIETVARQHTGPFADLVRLIIPSVAQVAATSSLGKVIKMVVGESGNFPELARIWHDELLARALGILVGLIERAQSRGEVRPGDPRNYAIGLISPVLVAVLFRETFVPVGGTGFDIPALARQHVETVLPGMLTEVAGR